MDRVRLFGRTGANLFLRRGKPRGGFIERRDGAAELGHVLAALTRTIDQMINRAGHAVDGLLAFCLGADDQIDVGVAGSHYAFPSRRYELIGVSFSFMKSSTALGG